RDPRVQPRRGRRGLHVPASLHHGSSLTRGLAASQQLAAGSRQSGEEFKVCSPGLQSRGQRPTATQTGYWQLATGNWLLATGYWQPATGNRLLATGYCVLRSVASCCGRLMLSVCGSPGRIVIVVE